MTYTTERALSLPKTTELAQFIALSSIALAMPFLIHLQWITGPIVNAILIITLFLLGVRAALFLCLIPSMMALAGGLLPAILAPAVPFIMLSNVLMVLGIDVIYANIRENNKAYFSGLFVGAFAKYVFLFIVIQPVANLLIKQELAPKIAQIFGIAQLFTALTGGLLAFGVLKWLKRI